MSVGLLCPYSCLKEAVDALVAAFTEPAAPTAPGTDRMQAVDGSDDFDMDLDVRGSLGLASRCYIL